MTTAESWNLTPLEFSAREAVMREHREADQMRWTIDRVERLNAPHFFRKDKQPYTVEDFLPKDAKAIQTEKDKIDLARELAYDKMITEKMQRADFDDSWLPGWARMTPEEKAKRGKA